MRSFEIQMARSMHLDKTNPGVAKMTSQMGISTQKSKQLDGLQQAALHEDDIYEKQLIDQHSANKKWWTQHVKLVTANIALT